VIRIAHLLSLACLDFGIGRVLPSANNPEKANLLEEGDRGNFDETPAVSSKFQGTHDLHLGALDPGIGGIRETPRPYGRGLFIVQAPLVQRLLLPATGRSV